jgi:cytochrome P450
MHGVRRYHDDAAADLRADFAQPLPLMVIAELLGLPLEDWPRLTRWSEASVNLGNTVSKDNAEAERAFSAAEVEIAAYVDEHVAVRRRRPQDDLLTRLVEAEVDGQHLGERELLRFVELLLVAGTRPRRTRSRTP